MNPIRHSRLLILLGIMAGSASPVALSAPAASQTPAVKSQSVLVLDAVDGSVIYARRSAEAGPIASITKLMTALVVLGGGQSLDEQLEITAADRNRTQNLPSRLPVGTATGTDVIGKPRGTGVGPQLSWW